MFSISELARASFSTIVFKRIDSFGSREQYPESLASSRWAEIAFLRTEGVSRSCPGGKGAKSLHGVLGSIMCMMITFLYLIKPSCTRHVHDRTISAESSNRWVTRRVSVLELAGCALRSDRIPGIDRLEAAAGIPRARGHPESGNRHYRELRPAADPATGPDSEFGGRDCRIR